MLMLVVEHLLGFEVGLLGTVIVLRLGWDSEISFLCLVLGLLGVAKEPWRGLGEILDFADPLVKDDGGTFREAGGEKDFLNDIFGAF